MSTNHNRIKVADLETNQPNKILKTNQNGELEFSDVNNLQSESYNALDCITEGKVLDARQGKILKDMIDNKESVSLVNDLTTGGTAKALTAEMGKQLNERKLAATIATDTETQITTAVNEDNKVVSRSKLFNWWNNLINKTQTIRAIWNFNSGIQASGYLYGSVYTTQMLTDKFIASQSRSGYGTVRTQYESNAISCYYPNGNYLQISFADDPTQVNLIQYPNKSGTIALIDDLYENCQPMEDQRLSMENDVAFNSISFGNGSGYGNLGPNVLYYISTINNGKTYLQSNQLQFEDGQGNITVLDASTLMFMNNIGGGQLNPPNFTSYGINWDLPNKSGTIALKSDLQVKGQFLNRTAALVGGLTVGDYYNLPISGDNKIVCVV